MPKKTTKPLEKLKTLEATKKPLPKLTPKPRSKKPSKPEIQTTEFDATGKVLGRLATEIADALRGKNKPSFRPYMLCGDKVLLVNAAKIVVTGKKIEQKKYYHHTGYLGHLKTTTLKDIMVKNPGDALNRAVYGMLPKTKLRPTWMKNLEIKN